MSKDRYVYFIYSRSQQERIESVNKSAGYKNPKFGKVSVGGTRKTYTDIIENLDQIPFKDYDVLTSGYISKMKFTRPNF